MFLRCTTRKKNGKEHRYWNLVENRRVAGGQVVQRQVLYLGEINDSQCEVWRKSIEVFEDGRSVPRTVALFAEEQTAPIDDEQVIQVRLKDLEVRNARQWGGCWLVCELYEQLKLDQFWAERLPPGRKGTRWDLILQTLCIYRFIEPGSEWRLHRYWFDRSAVPELLGSGSRRDHAVGELGAVTPCGPMAMALPASPHPKARLGRSQNDARRNGKTAGFFRHRVHEQSVFKGGSKAAHFWRQSRVGPIRRSAPACRNRYYQGEAGGLDDAGARKGQKRAWFRQKGVSGGDRTLTAREGGFHAYIKEIPGVHSEGESIEEAQGNLMDAFCELLDVREGDAWKIQMLTFNVTPAPAAPAQTK
jgi:predicted RNase H-like HicB family nuclease